MGPTFKPLTQKERLEIVWKMSPPERLAELQLTPEILEHWVEVSVSLMCCGKGYSPSGTARKHSFPDFNTACSHCPVSVQRASMFSMPQPRGPDDKVSGFNFELKPWTGFSRSDATFTDVPGEHNTLMDIDHASQFQKLFRSRLEARGV
ncbi:hypothetical protein DFJ58DRAFT_847836 [Suillus subalutaceus]|uniref:uncharacterized protein n=1 Tax=Suillus subalutaceus TaxID=48586 RepID=UPI001B886D16|nr:uncharacterized protein DFJ58DRAFT_847836 [Suillus subalutaceus]KAG1833298.1 hypothetical protein DFJ58DRAFT_847836 [Suillus subalutaceus]